MRGRIYIYIYYCNVCSHIFLIFPPQSDPTDTPGELHVSVCDVVDIESSILCLPSTLEGIILSFPHMNQPPQTLRALVCHNCVQYGLKSWHNANQEEPTLMSKKEGQAQAAETPTCFGWIRREHRTTETNTRGN